VTSRAPRDVILSEAKDLSALAEILRLRLRMTAAL
jgi:hypothetical protein